MCLEVYWADPFSFHVCTSVASRLKKTEIKSDILTSTDMLLMIKEGVRGEICHDIHRYTKANKKYRNAFESLDLNYWDINNLYEIAMSQTLIVGSFKWVEDTSQCKKNFIENYNEDSDEGYFLEDNVQHAKRLNEIHNDLPYLCEKKNMKKVEKLGSNLQQKK